MSYITFTDPGLSIMEMYKEYNNLFWSKTNPWYKNEKFANKGAKKGKRTILSVPILDSTNKTYEEQVKLLPKDDSVPTAREVVALMIWQYQKNKKRLFENVYVRTSNISSPRSRVYVGSFDQDGLDIYSYWDGDRLRRVGLASSRKSANLDTRKLESPWPLKLDLSVTVKGVTYEGTLTQTLSKQP